MKSLIGFCFGRFIMFLGCNFLLKKINIFFFVTLTFVEVYMSLRFWVCQGSVVYFGRGMLKIKNLGPFYSFFACFFQEPSQKSRKFKELKFIQS